MSADRRDLPRGGANDETRKPDVRDCAQRTADGDIQWRATAENYPHRGGIDGTRS